MWGIIPAAGRGSRIQPLAFSKELLPVGSRGERGEERPVAVSEYLIERLVRAGVDKLCFVISSGKSDILEYYGGRLGEVDIFYVVQNEPLGLCDALFRAARLISDEDWAFVGLPDTIWFPVDALRWLDDHPFSLLLFPVERPELFDAVNADATGRLIEIEVKAPSPRSHWIWGAFKLRGRVLRELYAMWVELGRGHEYIGSLVNEFVARGGDVRCSPIGRAYVDVGTVGGYREATRLLEAVKLLADNELLGADRRPAANRGAT